MTITSYDTWWWPYLFILLAGWLPTNMWRYLGVFLSGNIDEKSEALVFVRTVATALMAAVIAKLVLYPEGALAASSQWLRLSAAILGFSAYWFSAKKAYVGVLVGEAVLIGGMLLGH
jgi:branched-subunit amino acid transport protein